ncbi:MAG: hypothetical protein ACPGQS_02840 [Bradymonadia bacterium]
MNIFRKLGYLGASVALFACGEAQQFDTQVEESVLGQAEYSIQRACLSEDARLFDACTDTRSDDRACRESLQDARSRCDALSQSDEREPTRESTEADRADRPDSERPERETERDTVENDDLSRITDARDVESDDDVDIDTCESRCRAHAHESFLDCVETGRDERVCRDYAGNIFESCIEERCEEPEEPAPLTCEDKCRAMGHNAFDRCVESGRRPVMCRAYASRLIQNCIKTRCAPVITPRPGPSPRPQNATCETRARAAHGRCIRSGRPADVCSEYAHRVHAACVNAETDDDVDESDDEDAETACGRRARGLFAQCINNGGSRLRCQALAHRFFDYCISQADAEEPIEPEIVEEDPDTQINRACAERARHVERECLAARGDAETCARGARRAYVACVGLNEETDDVSEDHNNVGDRECVERALRLYSGCIESGNEPSQCRRQAYAAQERCEAVNDAEDEQNENEDNVCTERVRALYAECVEEGGEPRRCAQFVQAAHEQCEAESSRR